jgi:DNA-binding response OmpR family regulator
MFTSARRIALIGVAPRAGAAFERWCAEEAFSTCWLPLEPAPDVAKLREVDAAVIGAEERPLLSLAECGRLRSALPGLAVALVGPPRAELEEAVLRAGARFIVHSQALPAPRDALADLVTARRATLETSQTWVSARLCIDRTARLLYLDGERRSLSSAKFDLFAYLLDNAGRAVSAHELVHKGLLLPSQASRYKGLIAELRQRLGAERDCIRAVPGYGYRLDLGDGTGTLPPSSPTPLPQNSAWSVRLDPRSPTPTRPLLRYRSGSSPSR